MHLQPGGPDHQGDLRRRWPSGSIDGRGAFLSASEAGLSGTADAPGVSNIFDVDFYQRPEDIPEEYLPPAAFITFAEDLPTADR